jgi:transmembrane sensor
MATGAVTTRKLDNVQKAIAWTRNEIAFDGETVASVVAEFNRYNRIQIVVEDPAVAALPITGVFHTFDIQSFSQFLAGLPNVQVLETDRVVRVIGTRHDG